MGSLAAVCSLYKAVFVLQVMRESVSVLKSLDNAYQVLQVTCAVSEHAMKSKVRMIKNHFHTSDSCECMGVNGEALQLCAVYIFLLQVT